MEVKPIEVIIRIDFASSSGTEIVFHGERVSELVRCKDCKHRPTMPENSRGVFDLEFPDDECPCQCGDPWYNREPEDDWFCANGERLVK